MLTSVKLPLGHCYDMWWQSRDRQMGGRTTNNAYCGHMAGPAESLADTSI